MAALPRASLLLGASAALGALLLRTRGPESAGVSGEDDARPRGDGDDEDAVSYIQRFTSKARLNASEADPEGPRAKFYSKGDESVIPRPGADYPEQLRGVFWLDESGDYGHADTVQTGVPLLVSFAGSLDKAKRFSSSKGYGPTWTWSNNKQAYGVWRDLSVLDFRYDFQFNEDYTSAQVYPTFFVAGLPLSVWTGLLDFRMYLQTPAKGECPPRPGASKEEVSKCAVWIRKSWLILWPWNWSVYPMFRVLDDDGAPIPGAYDAYVATAEATAQLAPDAGAAEHYLGGDAGDPKQNLWFVGTAGGAPLKLSEALSSEVWRAVRHLREKFKWPSFGLF